MNIKSIFDTPFARACSLEQQARQAALFLQSKLSNTDLEPEGYTALLSRIGPATNSHLVDIFKRLIESAKINELMIFSYANTYNNLSIPEILTSTEIPIDGAFLPNSDNLSPKVKKPWVNLTPFVKITKETYSGPVKITDQSQVYSLVVKNYLCSHFSNTKGLWLTPNILSLIIEVYAKTMVQPISVAFNLDDIDYKLMYTLYALYMAQMLTPAGEDTVYPRLLLSDKNVPSIYGNEAKLREILKIVNDIQKGIPLTRDAIVNITRDIGPQRLAKLDASKIERLVCVSSQSDIAMRIAMDFPPMFLYMILYVTDGNKHPVISNVLNNRMSKANVQRVLEELVKCRDLY